MRNLRLVACRENKLDYNPQMPYKLIKHYSIKRRRPILCARKAVAEELSRARILETARTLFEKEGYRSVSMRAVARELDYTPGALYYHFKDKAELFSAVVTEDFAGLDTLLDEVVRSEGDGGFSLLKKVFTSFIRFGIDNKRSFELMFLIHDADLEMYASPAKMKSYEKFAQSVAKGIQGSSAEQQNLVALVFSLFIALHGFVAYYVHTDRSYEEIAVLAESHVQLLLNGLR
jgi:AcrR family transcriptional regulator